MMEFLLNKLEISILWIIQLFIIATIEQKYILQKKIARYTNS